MIDGAGLSHTEDRGGYLYCSSYPGLTGSKEVLRKISAEVIETGATDRVISCTDMDIGYIQDIVIKIGHTTFRTCSGFVVHI